MKEKQEVLADLAQKARAFRYILPFWPVRAVGVVLVGVLEYILVLQGMLGGRGGWGHSKTRVKENLWSRTFEAALDTKVVYRWIQIPI